MRGLRRTKYGVGENPGFGRIDSPLASPVVNPVEVGTLMLLREVCARAKTAFGPLQCEERDIGVTHDSLAENFETMIWRC